MGNVASIYFVGSPFKAAQIGALLYRESLEQDQIFEGREEMLLKNESRSTAHRQAKGRNKLWSKLT